MTFEIKNRISVMGAILFSILKAQNINATISVLLLILPLKNLVFSGIFCIFAMYIRGGFDHGITLVIHHLKH